MNIKKIITVGVAGMAMWACAGVVSNVNVSNRYPWNGKVDIKFNLSQDAAVTVTALDKVGGTNLTIKALTEAGVPMQNGLTCLSAGDRHVVWDAATDCPNSVFENVEIAVTADEELYMVIGLKKVGDKYPVTYLAGAPKAGWAPEYKTKYLVLRKIKAGTFMMGSPADEWGRRNNEDLHQVTLTKDYYIGIFEVTIAQMWVVLNLDTLYNWGSDYSRGVGISEAKQFCEKISVSSVVRLDLPTEAQWERAYRCGTSSSIYTGASPTSPGDMRVELSGREIFYQSSSAGGIVSPYFTHSGMEWGAPVGTFLPNPWGLYDMGGGKSELCRDIYTASLGTDPVVDPLVSGTGNNVWKGGSYYSGDDTVRAAFRSNQRSSAYTTEAPAFRVVVEK